MYTLSYCKYGWKSSQICPLSDFHVWILMLDHFSVKPCPFRWGQLTILKAWHILTRVEFWGLIPQTFRMLVLNHSVVALVCLFIHSSSELLIPLVGVAVLSILAQWPHCGHHVLRVSSHVGFPLNLMLCAKSKKFIFDLNSPENIFPVGKFRNSPKMAFFLPHIKPRFVDCLMNIISHPSCGSLQLLQSHP